MEYRYGVVRDENLHSIIWEVCKAMEIKDDFLHLSNVMLAQQLIKETIIVETDLAKDKTPARYNYGVGCCQFDQIAFDDVKKRTRKKYKALALEHFGVNVDEIELRDLAFSPLLSVLFCRLFYKLVPKPLPTNLEDRAKYWKRYYNTAAGKGTVEGYIDKVEYYGEKCRYCAEYVKEKCSLNAKPKYCNFALYGGYINGETI